MDHNIRLSKSSVGQNELSEISKIFSGSCYLGMGEKVDAFEQQLCDFLGRDRDELAVVNSGTAALHLALEGIIEPGDEVLVPSLTYVASYQAITAAGGVPISVDINTDNLLLNIEDARCRVTHKTKAILYVHYASSCSNVDGVYELAKRYNLRVVEDAAHSFGTIYGKRLVGSFGDIVCFSFDGIKNLTCGEGGAVVSCDKSLVSRVKDARLLGVTNDTFNRFQGERSWTFDVKHQGYRYHMSDIFAAIGIVQLAKFDHVLKTRRREIYRAYSERISNPRLRKLTKSEYEHIVPHIYVIRVRANRRDEFREYMKKQNIPTGIHYQPNHLLTKFKTSYKLPNVEEVWVELVTLPLHPDLREEEVDYIIKSINQFI